MQLNVTSRCKLNCEEIFHLSLHWTKDHLPSTFKIVQRLLALKISFIKVRAAFNSDDMVKGKGKSDMTELLVRQYDMTVVCPLCYSLLIQSLFSSQAFFSCTKNIFKLKKRTLMKVWKKFQLRNKRWAVSTVFFMALNIVTQCGLHGLQRFTDIVRFYNLLKPFSTVENIWNE